MTERILSFSGLLIVLASLSGCTLTPTKIGNPNQATEPAFDTKAVPGSVWRSDDGGKTFEPKTFVDEKRKLTTADVLAISFLQREDDQERADALGRIPDVYVGTVDDMIFKTEDGAEVWQPVNFPPQKVYSFTADRRDPSRMFATGVVGDRGKIFRTTNDGESWEDVYTEPGTGTILVSLAEHPVSTNVIFAGTSTGTVVKSTNGGDTWKNVGSVIDGPVTDILFDAEKPFVTYALVQGKKMYYSTDGGVTWLDWDKVKQEERTARSKAASADRSGKTTAELQKQYAAEDKRRVPTGILSLTADPTVSGTLYAGTAKGLFVSRDYGKFWDELNVIESAKKFPIRAVAVSPGNPDEIVFAAGHVIYKSTDKGVTWAVVPLNIDREISVLVYDPEFPDVLYLGLRKMKK